jgi:hypothetical protein
MSEKKDEPAQRHQDQGGYGGSPTTEQMRIVGRRRRDAEEKLEHHLEEARHKEGSRDGELPVKDNAGPVAADNGGAAETGDIADIQNDDRLTAADRMDLIANQALAGDDDGPAPEGDKKP